MTRRPIERAYIRFVLDARYAAALREGGVHAAAIAQAEGLCPADLALLTELPPDALAVERLGRLYTLWDRGRRQLPQAIAHLEAALSPVQLAAVREDYFSAEFWEFETTLEVGAYGRGQEVASTIARFIERRALTTPTEPWLRAATLAREDLNCFTRQLHGDGGPLAAPSADATALVVDPSRSVCLSSERVDRYHTASTLYFALGPEAEEINHAHHRLRTIVGPRPMDPARRRAALSDPQIERFFVPEGDGWALRSKLYHRPTPPLLDPDASLRFIDRSEGSSVRIPLDVAGLRAAGELLPALRSTIPRPRADSLSADASALLRLLISQGLVVERQLRPRRRREDYGVTLVAHSCLALESPTARVLIDPLLSVRARPEVDATGAVDDGVDAVVISHCHWDHLNFDSLLHVDRSTPIVVPRQRHPSSIVNLNISQLCAAMGFSRIVELDPWESVEFGGIRLTALPYRGEGLGPGVARDWMTVHAQLGGRTLCALVDSCADAMGSMDEVLGTVIRRLGPVDLLFPPCSDFHYPIDSYTRRPFTFVEARAQYTGGPRDVVRWASIVDAGLVVPYALFHLTEADVERDPEAVLADTFRYSGLRELVDLMERAPAGPLCPLAPGDRLAWTPGSAVNRQFAVLPPRIWR